MNITESRLRRYIRSVINETNKWEREVLNRKRKDEPYLPVPTKSQEDIQKEEDEKHLEWVAEVFANNLVRLYKSYPEGEYDTFRKRKFLISVVKIAATREFSAQDRRKWMVEEMKKLNSSMADVAERDYLEDKYFWHCVYLDFADGIGIDY